MTDIKAHDTYASTRRCPACRQLHSWDFKTCQKCGADMPQERGCVNDKAGVGACPTHPNGCPRVD